MASFVRVGRHRRRALPVLDQLVWSAANAITLVAAARVLSVDGFGEFSAAVLVMMLSVVLSRSFVTEPFLLHVADPSPADPHQRSVAGSLLGGAVVLAPVVCSTSLTLFLFIPGVSGWLVLLVFVTSVVTVVQDAIRHAAVGLGRPGLAVISDSSWLLVAAMFLLTTMSASVATALLALVWWLAGASVALVVGLLALKSIPLIGPGSDWLARTRSMGTKLAAEAMLATGAATISILLVGSVAGSDQLAGLRGAFLLLGPMNSLTIGFYLAAISTLAGHTKDGVRILRLGVRFTLALVASWLVFAVVLILLPDALFTALLGDTWSIAQGILPVLVVASAIEAIVLGGSYGIRAWRSGRSLVAIRIMVAPLYLIGLPWAASVGGGRGYAVALTAVALHSDCSVLVSIRETRSRRNHQFLRHQLRRMLLPCSIDFAGWPYGRASILR